MKRGDRSKDEIIKALYLEKEMGYNAIGRIIGWPGDKVRYAVVRMGIKKPHPPRRERDRSYDEKVRNLYVNKGLGTNAIATELNCSVGRVKYALKVMGITLRPRSALSAAQKKHAENVRRKAAEAASKLTARERTRLNRYLKYTRERILYKGGALTARQARELGVPKWVVLAWGEPRAFERDSSANAPDPDTVIETYYEVGSIRGTANKLGTSYCRVKGVLVRGGIDISPEARAALRKRLLK